MAAGRPMKFETAEALEEAVRGYFDRISYQVPAVVSMPTGEVDKDGNVIVVRRLLTTPGREPGAQGTPVTETRWLKAPNVAGLCLHLGIAKDTWWRYAKKPAFRDVAEGARLRMEDYWAGRLDTKSAKGAAFALENCYGWKKDWKARQEVEQVGDGVVKIVMDKAARELAE